LAVSGNDGYVAELLEMVVEGGGSLDSEIADDDKFLLRREPMPL
jgi:hypothetical protein